MAKIWTIVELIIIVLLCFFAIPIRIERPVEYEDNVFQEFVQRHNRSYKDNSTEYAIRFEIFKKSLREIGQMNAKRVDDNSAIYGVTEYSDLTRREYQNVLLQKNNKLRLQLSQLFSEVKRKQKKLLGKPQQYALPLRVDWREKGVVTGVRDQGRCGACWAHSTVATIESMLAIKTGKMKELSVQQMIDCSLQNLGCRGGDTCLLLSWLVGDYISVLPKEDYAKTKECTGTGIHVTQYSCDDMTRNENEMLAALALHGPLAIGVNAMSWQNYVERRIHLFSCR
ncbi:cathepsin O-like isoform X2 [Ctenocephalides felis]|uniref:cathepsin O-like isoform X2 n=1 Tax=Ctenocephalides felis TaxID=7515 RepID=UPI000E6E4A7C|nr:cathepsin O-like isoform X2 [Ctenocephalides felis]